MTYAPITFSNKGHHIKTLFLAAKYLAIKDNSAKINKEHFIKAISNFEFKEEYIKTLLEKHLDTKISPSNKPSITEDDIKNAISHERVDFSPEVKEIKHLLEENGYGFDSDVIELIQEKLSQLASLYKLNDVKEKLLNEVYDQEIAIEAISDKLTEISYQSNKDSVKAIFFFLGPPATGKTYLAETLEKHMEGYKLAIYDMSTYSGGNQGFALMGLSKGYSNAGEGKLTSFVKENKKAICLFDEVEKAHPEILNSLLQVMSRGKAKDEFTQKEIDFEDAIFIFTSNLGSELYSNTSFISKLKENYTDAQNIILEAIGRETYSTSNGGEIPKLKPEFLSRVAQGDIVLFNKLSLQAYRRVARKIFVEYIDSFKARYGVEIKCTDLDDMLDILILTYTPMLDARRVKSKLAAMVFDKITDFLKLEKNFNALNAESISVEIELDSSVKSFLKTHIAEDKERNNKFLHALFRKNQTVSIEHSIVIDGATIVLKYSNPTIKKLPKSKDFMGEGSIVFEVPDISFQDIAGHKKAKKRLLEAIEYLKNPDKLEAFGITPPRGMLLYGPPGTGKTMLAKAFANEADLPFISTTGTEILNIETMRNIYKRAREYAPSIVFIDEIDAIGFRDGSRADVIINQFLTELNGFSDRADEMVFTISATNLKEKIDPAILRSGRIDLHIKIDALDKEARGYFIDKLLKKPNDGEIDREKLITFTAGMSGADLEKVSRESGLDVIRQKKEMLTEEIIIEQVNLVKYGERLTSESLEKLVEATAYHEAGHAVMSKVLLPQRRIEQITVTPRNNALGFVSYNLEDEIGSLTFDNIKNLICVAFAGRIAQMERFGDEGFDSGASSDLKRATSLAYHAIAHLGMDEEVGYISLSGLEKESIIGGITEQEIQKRVKELLSEQKKRTQNLVKENWESIEKVSKVLIESEFIDEDEFYEIVKQD